MKRNKQQEKPRVGGSFFSRLRCFTPVLTIYKMTYVLQLYCFFWTDCGISFVYLSNALLVYYKIAEIMIVMVIVGKFQYRMDFKKH